MATGGDLDSLLEEGVHRLQTSDAEGALATAEEALARAPAEAAALRLRAAALADLGRTEEARLAYDRALSRGQEDPGLLADAADFLLNRADPQPGTEDLEAALDLARRGSRLAAGSGNPIAGELALLEGQALSGLGDAKGALQRFAAARRALPGDPDVQVEHALALFELCRFEDADAELDEALRMSPGDAWAHHAKGRVALRLGRGAEAQECLARAHELAPEDFPEPISMSPEAFDEAVEEALGRLPEGIRRYLSNVAITVEDLPSEEELLSADPPLSPSILGIFRGAPLPEKQSPDPWSRFPSSITLYQRNLEAFARDEEELVAEIGVTLVHEVGHFLGLDEEELWKRGLD
jgi:predicted Zn-dependent protease with MMP-like domain/Flp pilus assembly protein TadD